MINILKDRIAITDNIIISRNGQSAIYKAHDATMPLEIKDNLLLLYTKRGFFGRLKQAYQIFKFL